MTEALVRIFEEEYGNISNAVSQYALLFHTLKVLEDDNFYVEIVKKAEGIELLPRNLGLASERLYIPETTIINLYILGEDGFRELVERARKRRWKTDHNLINIKTKGGSVNSCV